MHWHRMHWYGYTGTGALWYGYTGTGVLVRALHWYGHTGTGMQSPCGHRAVIVQSCNHAVVQSWSCIHAVVQSCSRIVVQSCSSSNGSSGDIGGSSIEDPEQFPSVPNCPYLIVPVLVPSVPELAIVLVDLFWV